MRGSWSSGTARWEGAARSWCLLPLGHEVQGSSWQNDVLTALVPLILQVSGQAWRSSSFSCRLCWILPEHIGMMLRFASTLDLPANQGREDQPGQDASTEIQ